MGISRKVSQVLVSLSFNDKSLPPKKPDNILVDYQVKNGKTVNFSFVISDWGTAGYKDAFFGGTPVYASPNAFTFSDMKDIFAVSRMAMELFIPGK